MVGDLINRIYYMMEIIPSVGVYLFGISWILRDSAIEAAFGGWGYRSFWLVGPDSPALVDAGGWIEDHAIRS